MLIKPTKFVFTNYDFDEESGQYLFNYKIEFENKPAIEFTERIEVSGKAEGSTASKILEGVHLMLGISYYKLYCPSIIEVPYNLDDEQASFWSTIYRKGLGEFCFENKLELNRIAKFPTTSSPRLLHLDFEKKCKRLLVGIGGGKDSLVAFHELEHLGYEVCGFDVQTERNSEIVEELKLPMCTVKRFLDPKIFENHPESFNGHVPISGVFAWLGILACQRFDYEAFVVGNEFSSNFGNIEYCEEEINHQWSKSLEFESMLQKYIHKFVTPNINYFSALRPFYEIKIVQLFKESKYQKYWHKFSSCNRAYKIKEDRSGKLWCGQCAKCAFVFLLMAAFWEPDELEEIFSDNLLDRSDLIQIYKDLLGFGEMKPFDCVGTFEECRAALWLAKDKFANCSVVKETINLITDGPEMVTKTLARENPKTLPVDLRFIGLEEVLLLGYGKEGEVTHKYINEKFGDQIECIIGDQNHVPDYTQRQNEFEFGIRTPGMPKTSVEIPYTTATNLFFEEIKKRGNKVVGVTGSKGKSTTSSLIASMLKAGGKKVVLLGNIGTPMLSALLNGELDDKDTIIVVELSSYMLDDIEFAPDIAVVTNLFPEHMPYHGGEEPYYNAKSNIWRLQDQHGLYIYPTNNGIAKGWAELAPGQTKPFTDLDIKNWDKNLIGEHNESNIQGAITVAMELGVNLEDCKKALANFKGLPHRLEYVGEFNGVKYYNDSIATNPQAVIQAIKALSSSVGPIGTILLGGTDRGADFTDLQTEITSAGISNAVLFPDSGKRILGNLTSINTLETDSMADAVRWAMQQTETGQICLLSTAAPSFTMFNNFEERGEAFKKEVQKIN